MIFPWIKFRDDLRDANARQHQGRARATHTPAAAMSLQRNDMLSTEGRAPRARRSCYVNEPAYGFFIAGSSLKSMNGVYIRRSPPATDNQETDEETDEPRSTMLYYTHMDTDWTMMLVEVKETEPSHFYRSRDDDSEWVFVDERSADRFSHKGNTIVPGAGVSWKHVHRQSGAAAAAGSRAGTPRASGYLSSRASQQLASAKDDDEDELPWQVLNRTLTLAQTQTRSLNLGLTLTPTRTSCRGRSNPNPNPNPKPSPCTPTRTLTLTPTLTLTTTSCGGR